jgi:hypothetical protein
MGRRTVGIVLALLVCASVAATSRAATSGNLPDLVEAAVSKPPASFGPAAPSGRVKRGA